jgi:small subunit ribosomal protein S6
MNAAAVGQKLENYPHCAFDCPSLVLRQSPLLKPHLVFAIAVHVFTHAFGPLERRGAFHLALYAKADIRSTPSATHQIRADSRDRAAEGSTAPSMKCALKKTGVRMPLYEHVMIARQDLSNSQAEGLIEHFGAVLADNEGKLVDSEYWGVKTMAYKINKNRKGHYAFLRTDAPAAAVQEMERLMRLHDDVMRVLTIKVDEHAEGPSVQMQKRDERDTRRERR